LREPRRSWPSAIAACRSRLRAPRHDKRARLTQASENDARQLAHCGWIGPRDARSSTLTSLAPIRWRTVLHVAAESLRRRLLQCWQSRCRCAPDRRPVPRSFRARLRPPVRLSHAMCCGCMRLSFTRRSKSYEISEVISGLSTLTLIRRGGVPIYLVEPVPGVNSRDPLVRLYRSCIPKDHGTNRVFASICAAARQYRFSGMNERGAGQQSATAGGRIEAKGRQDGSG
jgi:hypothetical protein